MSYQKKTARFKEFPTTPKIPKSLDDCHEHFKEKWGADYWEVDSEEKGKRHEATMKEAEAKYKKLWMS